MTLKEKIVEIIEKGELFRIAVICLDEQDLGSTAHNDSEQLADSILTLLELDEEKVIQFMIAYEKSLGKHRYFYSLKDLSKALCLADKEGKLRRTKE